MDYLWLFIAFSAGSLAGFLIFAMFQLSRGAGNTRRGGVDPVLLSLEFDGETISRM